MAKNSPFNNEKEGLDTRNRKRVCDLSLNSILNGMAQTAANLCESPIALINLSGGQQQWLKTCSGMSTPGTPLDLTFFSNEVLRTYGFMEIEDVRQNERLKHHPTVTGDPMIRFCAGIQLKAIERNTLGTICIIDYKPRQLTIAQRIGLEHLAQVVTDILSRHQGPQINLVDELNSYNQGAMSDLCPPGQTAANINPSVKFMSGKATSDYRHQEELINLLSRAIEAVDAGVSITDVNQIGHPLVYVNQALCQLTGFSADELVGQGVKILHKNSERQPEYYPIHEALSKGEAIQVITKCVKKDNSEYTSELSLSPVRNENGILTHYIGIRRDVTSKLRIEAQAHQAGKLEAVGKLSGGIAHDFNNLLSVISGNLELLTKGIIDRRQQNFLNEAQNAAKMGARLTRRLLTFARQRQLDPVVLDANDLALNTIELLKSTIGESITLASDLSTDLWTIRTDPSEVENTLVNLTINARDAMPAGGTITVRTRNVSFTENDLVHDTSIAPGDYIQLSVSDTGNGMSEEVKAQIFEPFFTTKEPDKGTGMGLASIHGFVYQSGGHIKISSEMGQGTTISLFLPKHVASDSQVIRHSANEFSTAHIDARILVVEDNNMVRELTINQLQLLGFKTEQASNGPEAIQYLSNNSDIDLVLSDVVMSGGMSGYDVAQWVHKHLPNLKLLLTTGYSKQMIVDDASRNKKLPVLQKPYSLMELQKAISNILES